MSDKLNTHLKNTNILPDPNAGNTKPKIPKTIGEWCFARLREPSTMIGLSLILTSISVNIKPEMAVSIATIILGLGGIIGFVMREKKNLLHEGGSVKIDINGPVIKEWVARRLAEPSSKIGIIMVLSGFGIHFSEAHIGIVVSVVMALLGTGAVVHREGSPIS